MKSSDLTSMGVKNLWRRKTRTLLTILGVIIGTAAIVTMVSLGLGMNKAFMKEMERMGNIRVITVSKYGGYWEEDDKKDKKDMPLDDEAVKFFDELEGVDVALPILRSGMEITAGRLQSYGSIIGVDFDKLAKFKYEIGEGRVPEAADKNGILVGASIPKQFYNPRSRRGGWGENEVDVMNERLLGYINGMYDSNGNKKKGIRLTPTGLLTEAYDERDWSIYMDVTVLKKILSDEERKNRGQRNTWENKRRKQEKEYEEIKILCKDLNDVEKVQEAVKARGYNAWSSFDFVKSQRKQIEIIQMVLGGIGAVSLLIAAIGITNTMIMAIYERTREIGVMKVLGAEIKDILRLFLFEAAMIGFFGGLLGLLVSIGGSELINKVAAGMNPMGGGMMMPPGGAEEAVSISYIPAWLMGASLLFSTFVGVTSGFFPALRATKLSALEAIKNE